MATDAGCLLIDDIPHETGALDALRDHLAADGWRAERFHLMPSEALHPALQRAYQRVRRDDALNALAGYGAGCDCAVAIASQLPAERLALLAPVDVRAAGEVGRQLRHVARYGRRGAAFCAADALIVPGPRTPPGLGERLRRALCFSRVALLQVPEHLWSEGKETLNSAILHFLRHGVVPKSLAENAEMCIIYG